MRDGLVLTDMCPQCGKLFKPGSLIPRHITDDSLCEGSQQNPRNPGSDRRLLWSGKRNPHIPLWPPPRWNRGLRSSATEHDEGICGCILCGRAMVALANVLDRSAGITSAMESDR